MTFVPKPQDDQLLVQDTVTKTATFKGAGFDQGEGFAPGGLGRPTAAVINVTAADRASGDETYTFTLQQSDDDVDGNYKDCQVSTGTAVTVSGTSATTGIYVVRALVSKRYVRLVMTAAGTTPSVTYKAWMNPNV